MLGDTFTGKTSLVLRFAEGHYRESSRNPTVGAFFITKRLSVQGITCKIQIWDTAGQEQFKKLAPMYYKNAAAAIVCYDITSPKSFETLKFWMEELQRNVPAGSIVLAMCATKGDLAGAHPDSEQTTMAAQQLADETGAMFMTTSAKEDVNVEQLFQKVAERVLQFQKQQGATINNNNNIPVTLATTAVDTPTKNSINNNNNTAPIMSSSQQNYVSTSNPYSTDGHPPYAQPRIATPTSTQTPLSTLSEEKKSEHNYTTINGMMDHHHHHHNNGVLPPNINNAHAQPSRGGDDNDDDDITVDKVESKDSSTAADKASNCLMRCGDDMMGGGVSSDESGESSCVLM